MPLAKLAARVAAAIGQIEGTAQKMIGDVTKNTGDYMSPSGTLKIYSFTQDMQHALLMIASVYKGAKESRQVVNNLLHKVDELV